ncbi:MBL fold metallo-hydrolase [Halomonas sp. M20]|uniref:MBL fold metallo-hydrolase n=1 Tax=Halomonas sp. M20 TaxID=2763264 RepID=UPI001D0A5CEB|nr:MBL fold metallo-hydrolase [Halomonas sp. M20]
MPQDPLNPMPLTSKESGNTHEILPDVLGLTVQIVNLYMVGAPNNPENWVLVDAGMPDTEKEILETVHQRFGDNAKPRAILLTHGHFDHVGAVVELAEHWKVPVYAHPLEMPYLTGDKHYPEGDDKVEGGLVAKLSRYFPTRPVDLRPYIQALPEDGRVPGLPDWQWLHTPGHTPGHVSFFREADRALIAGDAFVTVRQDELYQVLTQRKEINGPPRYFTPDWDAARESVQRLAALKPRVAMTGHGLALAEEELTPGLEHLVQHFDEVARPNHGKSVGNR